MCATSRGIPPLRGRRERDVALHLEGALEVAGTILAEKAAYAISQYFTMGKTEVQIRTSGFSKFGDYEIPADVLNGSRAINVTGILTMYQGSIQVTVNSQKDFTYEDGTPLYK